MPNQVLIIEPENEIKFNVDDSGVFEVNSTTYMQLTNPSQQNVLFKIKTTAPNTYSVRPNSGSLAPNSKVEIAISSRVAHVEANERHKHKFMVQSAVAPEAMTWKEISPDKLMEHKLKCVYESQRATNANKSGDSAAQTDVAKKRVAIATSEPSKTLIKDAIDLMNEGKKPGSEVNSPLLETLDNNMTDMVELEQEGLRLRHENLRLKEELLRFHKEGISHIPYGMTKLKISEPSIMPWVLITFAMSLLGFLIGKFF